MTPFHRVGKCWGLTVWTWRRRVEVWCCFEGVKPHTHPGQAVEIVPVFGWATFFRKDEHVSVGPRTWWRAFSIPAGWVHWFNKRTRWPLVFLNITTGGSAADNFAL